MNNPIKFIRTAFVAILMFASLLGAPVARADRWEDTPTSWWWKSGASETEINNKAAQGYRVTNIEIDDTSPYRFTVIMVRNSGVFHEPVWGWWFDKTGLQMDAILNDNGVRAIDLETYAKDGQTRFAVVLVGNTGPDAKGSWHFSNKSWDEAGDLLAQHSGRLIDLDTRIVGGVRKFDGVMLANTGADSAAWWRYSGDSVDVAYIAAKLDEHNARLIDIERREGNTFTVVMQQSEPGMLSWWYLGVSETQVNDLLAQNGARLIDVEMRQTLAGKRFDVIMINNSNALTTRVGQLARAATDGAVGFGLKVVSGPQLAGLNTTRKHYPASAIKIMEHIHAMRWASSNVPNPAQPLSKLSTQLTKWTSSCSNSGTSSQVSLGTQMTQMMQNSDNDSTNSIMDFMGLAAIDTTMHSVLNLSDATQLVNRLGCNGGNLADPANSATVQDMMKTYEAVATGAVPPAYLEQFWVRMNSELNTPNGTFRTLTDQHADSLGLSDAQRAEFLASMRWIAKAGSWTDANSKSFSTNAGLVLLPLKTCDGIVFRRLVFSTFVDSYTTLDPNLNLLTELFTDEFRAALRSFKRPPLSGCASGFATVPIDEHLRINALQSGAAMIEFDIDAHTFGDDTPLEFSRLITPATGAGKRAVPGMAVGVNPLRGGDQDSSIQPRKPLTISISYGDDVLAAFGQGSLQLMMRQDDAQPWTDAAASCAQPLVVHVLRAHTLDVQVCHFTQFALFGTPRSNVLLPMVVR